MSSSRLLVFAFAPLLLHCGQGDGQGDLATRDDLGDPTREETPEAGTPHKGPSDAGSPSPTPDAAVTPVPDNEPRLTFACGQPGGGHTATGGHDVWNVRGRGYRYFVPNGYDANRAYPVVVALHGLGSPVGGLSFSDWFGFHERVEDAAIVVYPSAAGDWNLGDPWSDFAYLDEVLADLGGKLCFDRHRTYGLGFSRGGWFAQRWACRRPDVVRALAVTASGWPGEEDPAACAKVSTLVYGRTLDPTVGIDNTRWAREQNRASLSCWGNAETPPWMLRDDQGSTGCSSYANCGSGKNLAFCEDSSNLSQGDNSWNHTFARAYHTPVWRWLESQ